MRAEDRFPSTYLKADNLTNEKGQSIAKRVTITHVEEVTFPDGKQGVALSFKETDKKLTIRSTNWNAIAKITGKPDDAQWAGEKIEIYRTMVEFKGEMVASIRCRPVGGWDAAPVVEEPHGEDASDEPLPF